MPRAPSTYGGQSYHSGRGAELVHAFVPLPIAVLQAGLTGLMSGRIQPT